MRRHFVLESAERRCGMRCGNDTSKRAYTVCIYNAGDCTVYLDAEGTKWDQGGAA